MSYLCTRLHLIWSTKERTPLIEPAWENDLYAYLNGILEHKHSHLLAIGGIDNHLHLYASLPPTLSIAELANSLKANSSRWIHENHSPEFSWQEGYSGFTMSKSTDEEVCAYIQKQKEHHRQRTFQEELIALLDKFGVTYDRRYVFA